MHNDEYQDLPGITGSRPCSTVPPPAGGNTSIHTDPHPHPPTRYGWEPSFMAWR